MKDNEEPSNEIVPFANYTINRRILTQDALNEQTNYEPHHTNIKESIKRYYNTFNFRFVLESSIPIIKWLPKYSIKKNLLSDIMSGFTVAIMQIPQAMAYAMLTGVQPVVGLYMAFFPVLVYLIFGTSRHVSIGTFAVVALMTRDAISKHTIKSLHSKINNNLTVEKYFSNTSYIQNQTIRANESFVTQMHYTDIEVVTALSITTSIIQFAMAIFKVGKLSTILTDPLVKGFTTAIAFHVITSQLGSIFGLKIEKNCNLHSHFKILNGIICVVNHISETNIATLIITLCVIISMIITNEIIKPYFSKFCPYLLPSELIIILTGTLVFTYTSLVNDYDIAVIGKIPTGLPKPNFPPLPLFNKLWIEAAQIAILTFSIIISMGLLFAKKHGYHIKPNQELYALGFSNLVGGCFSCMPSSCSISRSLLQEQSGGVTQIASFVASMVNLLVLLLIGPFFENLPKCMLSGIIIASLKTIFMQLKEVKIFAKQGRMELAMWCLTFFTVLIFDYILGLAVGILVAVIVFFLKSVKPYYCVMGTLPVENTGIYVCLDQHKAAVEFYYAGSINFVTKFYFKKCFFETIKFDSDLYRNNLEKPNFKTIILNLSAVAHLDVPGCQILTEILKEFNLIELKFFLASPSHNVYDSLVHGMSLGEGPFLIVPTVHDAVLMANTS